MKKYKMSIQDVREIAKDTYELRLEPMEDFLYNAGQYVSIIIDKKCTDGRGKMRSFSLSSSPNNKKYISTCFRLPDKHSEFKDYIVKAEPGTLVSVDGPRGVFCLPKETDKEIVMIAGGVGITPFISMLKDSTTRKTGHKIKLLYTDKAEERMAYFDELVKLEVKNKKFKFVHRLKRVDKEFIEENCDLENSIFYVCGTPGMVEGVSSLLHRMGVFKKNIKFENFTGY